MPYSEFKLKPMSLWKHRDGGLYIVLGVGLCSTNGDREHKERSVIYWSDHHGHLCYREISEFLDGRFRPIETE
jgi:hypothetical protein